MSEENFSSHLIYYLDKKGVEEFIKIDFAFGSTQNQDVGEGEMYSLYKVVANFQFFNENHIVRAYGDNRVQALFRAMKLIGIIVFDVAAESGIDVYKYEPGDALEHLDLFS